MVGSELLPEENGDRAQDDKGGADGHPDKPPEFALGFQTALALHFSGVTIQAHYREGAPRLSARVRAACRRDDRSKPSVNENQRDNKGVAIISTKRYTTNIKAISIIVSR